ncbi:hypothetical protein D8770_21845 [Methylobacterium sp. DB1607]|nr:hypothetical protein [Methylobacterium sp. DB1607]
MSQRFTSLQIFTMLPAAEVLSRGRAMPPDDRTYDEQLRDRLGAGGVRRLSELIGAAGGLTPTEARQWFELSAQDWHEVEALAFMALDDCEQRGAVLPWHLVRWLDRRRHHEPTTSLFA